MRSSSGALQLVRGLGVALTSTAFFVVVTACSSAPDASPGEVAVKNQASEYSQFGNSYFLQANYPLALQFFELALRENTSIDNLPGIAKSHNSIGRVHAATGSFDLAQASFRTALETATTADDAEQRIQAYINLGELALRRGMEDDALAFFESAESEAEARPDLSSPVLYHNLGAMYARQGVFDQAETQLQRARELNLEQGNWVELASNYYMLASIYSRQDRFDEARAMAEQALDYDKRAENSIGIAADLEALGRITLRMGERDAAYEYLLRSLRVYLTLNLAPPTIDILETLEQIARDLGRDADADEFARQRRLIAEAIGG